MQPQLAVSFARDHSGRTYLARQRATHPFHLCRPLYRSDDPAGLPTLYLQGCSGGLFEGDRWALDVRVQAGARAHVTSSAATLVHRMAQGGTAEQALRLEVEANALLEYFPDPLILFSGSRLRNHTSITLAPGARLIAIESVLPHRLPDDTSAFAWFENLLRVQDPRGSLLARERFRMTGKTLSERACGITGSHACQASVLVLGAGAAPLAAVRDALVGHAGVVAGASLLPDDLGVLARVLASDGARLRAVLQRAWAAARISLGVAPERALVK
jgi:urease accessory protein